MSQKPIQAISHETHKKGVSFFQYMKKQHPERAQYYNDQIRQIDERREDTIAGRLTA